MTDIQFVVTIILLGIICIILCHGVGEDRWPIVIHALRKYAQLINLAILISLFVMPRNLLTSLYFQIFLNQYWTKAINFPFLTPFLICP